MFLLRSVARWSWVAGVALLVSAGQHAAGEEPVTFNKHVAPILFKHCASCHRPGEIAPFTLLTYKDAARRANFLKEVTANRRMPPWKAEPGYGEFQDVRRLADADIKTVARWAEMGAQEGDARDLPPAPQFPADGWVLGTPDLVLKMPEQFTVPAGGRDIFRAFVIPTEVRDYRTVGALDFRPGNRRVVHHALFFLDSTGLARRKDLADPGPGFETPPGDIGMRITGFLGGWEPGRVPKHLPEGMGNEIREGSDLVLQIHYHPTGKEEKDQSTLAVYFTKKPAQHLVTAMPLDALRLNIPAADQRYRVSVRYSVPVDVRVISLTPHMHNLGREMKVTAVLPDGQKQPMVWVKDWDFNWQGRYQYVNPVALPRGTMLELEAFFDNSSADLKNPNNPPREVRDGPYTTDEMCKCHLDVITDHPSDRLLLIREMRQTIQLRLRAFGPK